MPVIQLAYSPETNFRNFCHQLARDIAADPSRIPLSAQTIADFNITLNKYDDAWNVAKNPQTNSVTATRAKNVERSKMTNSIRSTVDQIQAAPMTDDVLRAALGLPIRDRGPTPSPIPGAPTVLVLAVEGHRIKVRLGDADDPTRRGKPAGVTSGALMTFVGETPSTDSNDWQFQGITTRVLATAEIAKSVPAGSKVWVSAVWFNARGKSGAPSQPVMTRVNFADALRLAA